jgi:hypothetical protein
MYSHPLRVAGNRQVLANILKELSFQDQSLSCVAFRRLLPEVASCSDELFFERLLWSRTKVANLRLNIVESPSPELSVERYTPDFSEFQELFPTKELTEKHPLRLLLRKPYEQQVSVVLQNKSPKSITVLAFHWIFPEAPDHSSIRKYASNSYHVELFRPVLPAGAKMLASPLSENVEESVLTHIKAGGGVIAGLFRSSRDPILPDDGEIGFVLDLVGFEDGEIAGPDPDRYGAKLQSRKHAAEFVARQIHRAEMEQRDPAPVLQALIELPRKRDDQHMAWVQKFARDYISPRELPKQELRLQRLENLLSPPKFFRKQDSQPPLGPVAP